ncbi:MAG: PAS domain S-box protein [Phycisphaerae bacterium]|nr:PAS domain S-box protein [Phycisphaerae bacterium]
MAILLTGGLFIFHAFGDIADCHQREHRAIELTGIITQLDEVLTSSAYLAAATGDSKWEGRYRKYAPQLDAAIKEAVSLIDAPSGKYAGYTDLANMKLVAMENKAFEFVRQGNHQAALELLESSEYEEQKFNYASGMYYFAEIVQEHIKEDLFTAQYMAWGITVFVVTIAAITMSAYFSKIQLYKRSIERNRLAAIVDSSDDAIVGSSPEGIITSWNKGSEKIYGYREYEIIGESLSILVPSEQQDDLIYLFEKISQGEHIRHFETVHIGKDNNLIDVSLAISPVNEVDGKISGVSLIARDITKHKESEKTKERLAAILEATPDFVGYADANDRHIMYINKAGRKMCGIGEDEDVTKFRIDDVHPERTNKMFSEEVLPLAIRNGVWMGECALLNVKDRHEIPVLMVLAAHKSAEGQVEIFSTISRSVTEPKKMKELESAGKATG